MEKEKHGSKDKPNATDPPRPKASVLWRILQVLIATIVYREQLTGMPVASLAI